MANIGKPESPVAVRVTSIDALRGFDMMWITGGEEVIHALNKVIGHPVMKAVDEQFHHVRWEGFHFYDLIFPLFLFIVGLVLPFSLTRRLEAGANRAQLYRHLVRRLLLLLVLGWVYYGLLDFRFHDLRLAGVLQRIAVCYFLAALVVMNTGARGQALTASAVLLLYWAVMMLVPVPGFGAGVLTPQGNLGAWVDQHLLPRPYCCNAYGDAEGILSTFPAVCTTLLGVLAGHWLRSDRSANRKAQGLALAGVASLLMGVIWGHWFPVIKYLWTSSYVLVAGGWSLLLTALFYYIIDARGYRRWSFFFFTVIGMNAITIYLARRLFDFDALANVFVHGFIGHFGAWTPVAMAVSSLAAGWIVLWFLYRQRIFLKV